MDTLALLGNGVKDFDIEKRDFRKIRPKVSFLNYHQVFAKITFYMLLESYWFEGVIRT